ncbi:uncharacterized protein [Coffea arabica]|uniref:Reverse transcriptase domain-containing protein n=1 Tax=Coffea arabica TaxID=13443 RepID=A0ABM4VY18_COFAR
MAEGTRSQDNRRFEKSVKAMMKEQKEQFEQEMAALQNLVLELHSQRGQSARNSPSENEVSQGRSYQAPTRFSRLEFPRFHGEDLQGWLFKIEQFFEVDEMPVHVRVKLVAMNLEGKALQWHQILLRSRVTRDLPAWEEYIKEMASRFGGCLYDDSMGELKALKQEGSVLEYQEQFEELLNRVDLPEDYATSCFISGLKTEIQLAVRMFMPKTLQHARWRREGNFEGSWKKESNLDRAWRRDDKALLPTPNQERSETVPERYIRRPFKRLTSSEMDEKRAKGLYFWCDEKFGVGHRCKNRQLFRLEVCAEEDGEELEIESEEEGEASQEASQGNLAHISLNAMTLTDVPKFRTMRVTGHVGKTSVNIFIDCGSSHNFVHPDLVNKLGLKVQGVPSVVVEVADGNKITTNKLCPDFTWKMHKQTFKADAMVLPVGGCELVLGMQWLSTLGDIKWNFGELKVEFLKEKRKVVLRGKGQQAIQVVQKRTMQKILQKPEQIASAQLCFIAPVQIPAREQTGSLCQLEEELQVANPSHGSEARELNELLMQFKDIFEEPSELPPHRGHDHQIILKEGTVPVNLRPYRYHVFQKNEIEKLIQEMLQSGVIRHSTSPFSSPVVLVKKKDGTWRMCIDYRELNAATVKDKFPIPVVEELIDELFESHFFTKLDLRSGYHQIRICADDIAKTAFRTHEGHYEFVVMPFGQTNAPSTFQSLMNTVIRPYLRKFILVFFDDILVFSPIWPDHMRNLQITLGTLRQHSLKVKKSKCFFAQPQVAYLGHVISGEGVQADSHKVQAIQQWPIPSNLKELRGFLGLAGYYRRFK